MDDLPFDVTKLDTLLEEAGAEAVLATTKPNVQYLLGGYRYFFFEGGDAIGLDRYLPVVGYVKGRPEDAFYVGAGNENWGLEVHPIWVPRCDTTSWTAEAAARVAAASLTAAGLEAATIALERAFFPVSAMEVLHKQLPNAQFVDATALLQELRAVKSAAELEQMRAGAAAVVDAVLATFQALALGDRELDVVQRLRVEQTSRGLGFDYALINTGTKVGRAPSTRRVQAGDTICLDTAGYYYGYLADMARMAVVGEPTPLLTGLYEEIETVQQAARSPIRQGVSGGEIYKAVAVALQGCPHRSEMTFLAHGMGLIPHEAPHLTASGAIPYPATHAERPLEAGMVLSIETHMVHPNVGFVKLEDTVAVTKEGWEAFGDWGRGWNMAGSAR